MIAVLALVMFVVMFLVVFVLRTIIQKRTTGDSGVRAGVLSSAAGSLEWVAGWLLVLALLAGVGAPIGEILGLEPITSNPWVRGAGVVVATTGIAVTFMAQMNMGSEWRIGIDEHETTGLVTHGAFAVVRNPIFSAMVIVAVGLAVMIPNPISIVGVVALVAAIELQVRCVEEPHLRRLHGSTYTAYETRVGRFLPQMRRTRPLAASEPPPRGTR